MIGCLTIEYAGKREALPAILDIVQDSELTIHGLRSIPVNQSEKVTLSLDLGCPSRSTLAEITERLTRLDSVTRVVHLSAYDPRAAR